MHYFACFVISMGNLCSIRAIFSPSKVTEALGNKCKAPNCAVAHFILVNDQLNCKCRTLNFQPHFERRRINKSFVTSRLTSSQWQRYRFEFLLYSLSWYQRTRKGKNHPTVSSFSKMRLMWYFAHCDLMSPELISTLASRAEPFLAAQPQWLRLAVLSSPPWSVNVIRVIHLTPSLVWLNYLAFLWTAKLIPCDFNKLRAEGEHLSEGGQWLLFSDASLMNVSGSSPQKKN